MLTGFLKDSELGFVTGTTIRVHKDIIPQVDALRDAFKAHFGVALRITDGYRSYEEQVAVKIRKGALAATPGTSVHGLGLALDLGSGVNQEGSAQYLWMKKNAGTFGFAHPKWAEDNNPRNGAQEPWHWEGTVISGFRSHSVVVEKEDDDMPTLDEVKKLLEKPWYKFPGSNLAWIDLGDKRRAGSAEMYTGNNSPGIVLLDITDVFWSLPPVSPSQYREWYRVPGTEKAWVLDVENGITVRRHTSREVYEHWGSNPIVDLPSDNPFWKLTSRW